MPPNSGPMGQIYLGFRSLLVKIAIFVVMAALLAWALGGTLWPKTEVKIVGRPVDIDGQTHALVYQIGGSHDRGTFGLARIDDGGGLVDIRPKAEWKNPTWIDAMAPVVSPDAWRGAIAYQDVDSTWRVVVLGGESPADSEIDGLARLDAGEVEDRWAAARALETFERTGAFTQPADDEADATGEASPAG